MYERVIKAGLYFRMQNFILFLIHVTPRMCNVIITVISVWIYPVVICKSHKKEIAEPYSPPFSARALIFLH